MATIFTTIVINVGRLIHPVCIPKRDDWKQPPNKNRTEEREKQQSQNKQTNTETKANVCSRKTKCKMHPQNGKAEARYRLALALGLFASREYCQIGSRLSCIPIASGYPPGEKGISAVACGANPVQWTPSNESICSNVPPDIRWKNTINDSLLLHYLKALTHVTQPTQAPN